MQGPVRAQAAQGAAMHTWYFCFLLYHLASQFKPALHVVCWARMPLKAGRGTDAQLCQRHARMACIRSC